MPNPERQSGNCNSCGRPQKACKCTPQEKFKSLVQESNLDSNIKEQFEEAADEYDNGPWSVEDHVESISQDGDKITIETGSGSQFYYIRNEEVDFSLQETKESKENGKEEERELENAKNFIEEFVEDNEEMSDKVRSLFIKTIKEERGFWDRDTDEISNLEITKDLDRTRITIKTNDGSQDQLDINPRVLHT